MSEGAAVDLQQRVDNIIDGDGDDKPRDLEIMSMGMMGRPVVNLGSAVATALMFLRHERTSSGARCVGNLGRSLPSERDRAVEILGDFLKDQDLSEDIRKTATVELGSIATIVNESLKEYDAEMDEKPGVAQIQSILSALKNGVYPQVAWAIEPVVMETKSPAVITECLQILLQSTDEESAKVLDKVLDDKQRYDTQKILAISGAISNIEEMSTQALKAVTDYFHTALPQELRKLEKSVTKFQGLGKMAADFSKIEAISRNDAAAVIKAGRKAMETLKDLSSKSEIFDTSHLEDGNENAL